MSANAPHVRLVNVVKRFGNTIAADSVSLDVGNGEFLTLLGPSGCGKSTLLRIVAGLETPDSGDILIKGKRVNEQAPYMRNVGMVFQNYALFPHMTVYDNLRFGLRMRHVPKEEMHTRITKALDLVQLGEMVGRYSAQLSGGQQQRVALARALVIEPDVLLLDEPLSNLDLKLRNQMRIEVRAIQQKVGITTIYVTHDQGEAFATSDRLAVMNSGKIVQMGSPTQVYENPCNTFVSGFVGTSNSFAGVVSSIDDKGIGVKLETGLVTYGLPCKGNAVEKDSKVTVCIRPERIHISQQRTQDRNSYPALVEMVCFLGSIVEYRVSINGLSLNLEKQVFEVQSIFEIGDKVFVEWSPENCLLFS